MPSKEVLKDLKIASELEDMLLTPGWKHFSELLEMKIKERTITALMPIMPSVMYDPERGSVISNLDGVSHVLVGEASKGAIMGLRLALGLPSDIIAGAKAIRDSLKPSAED